MLSDWEQFEKTIYPIDISFLSCIRMHSMGLDVLDHVGTLTFYGCYQDPNIA